VGDAAIRSRLSSIRPLDEHPSLGVPVDSMVPKALVAATNQSHTTQGLTAKKYCLPAPFSLLRTVLLSRTDSAVRWFRKVDFWLELFMVGSFFVYIFCGLGREAP
jgi:hypothetical protein